MLYFFTDPYPEEAMFSVYARYHMYSANTNELVSMKQLSGTRKRIKASILPFYLDYICRQLDNKIYTPDHFIYKHSIFPLYKPFLTEEKTKQLIDDMTTGNPAAAYMRIGEISAGICKEKSLKICSKCVDEDYSIYGEAYFHRIHQVPGNFICCIHNELLREMPIKCNVIQIQHIKDIYDEKKHLKKDIYK
jgi:hypothetical protein